LKPDVFWLAPAHGWFLPIDLLQIWAASKLSCNTGPERGISAKCHHLPNNHGTVLPSAESEQSKDSAPLAPDTATCTQPLGGVSVNNGRLWTRKKNWLLPPLW